MSFLEVSGALVFHLFKDEMHPVILKMWQHMRTYALYFLQYRTGQHTVAQIRMAQQHMYLYAVLAETHLQGKLLTLLLHRAVVHIPEQALQIGPTAAYREDWGERGIRAAKGPTTGHAMRRPAQAAANKTLLTLSLGLAKMEDNDVDMPLRRRPAQAGGQACKTDCMDEYGVQLHEGLKPAYTGHSGDVVRIQPP